VRDRALGWEAPAPFDAGMPLAEALLTPTRIYVKTVLAAIRETSAVKALAHITGGGLTENLPRVLPEGVAADIDLTAWKPRPVFAWIAAAGGVAESEMLRTFNCGIGLVLVCAASEAGQLCEFLSGQGEDARIIGTLREAEGKPSVRFLGSLGFQA
jgi:phosphoribosylformylglycinamidine cyclo-ligase